MKLRKSTLIAGFFLLAILYSACTPYYLVSDFETRTADHMTVAVLPFEMWFTGRIPKDLTEEDILEIEEIESLAFQRSMYNEILKSTKSGKKPIRINLQDYKKTLNILHENGIDVRTSWSIDAQEIADLLGVDAVLSARIEKMRLMSDLASFGAEVGLFILHEITDYGLWPFIPGAYVSSKQIDAHYLMHDKSQGAVLWSISFKIDADWSSSADDILRNVTRRAARKFPYRINKK